MIRALIGIGLLQFASMLLLLVRTKILATTVGLTGVGTISAVDSLTAVVAQTLSLSMPFATLRFLPAALRVSPEETDLLYRRMRAVMVALLVPATVVCVGIAIVAPERWGAALVPYQRTLILAFASLPVVGLIPFFTNVYAGAIGHRQAMTLTIAHAGVMVVAAAVAGAGLGVAGFYGAYALLGTVLIVVAARRLRIPGLAMAERRRLSLRDAFRLPPVVWRFAAWLLPLMFAASYTAYFVRYSTLRLFGANATGILQGAIGISLSVKALLGTAHGIFLTPHVNRQADPAARMAWANEFQRTTGLLFVVTLPPLLLFSDIALRLLYSAPFRAGSPFVALFVAAEVLTMLSGTYQSLIIAGDRMRFHVLQNLAAQALLAGTAAVALPRLGLAGAGIAVLTAPVFMFVSTLVFLDRVWGVHVSRGAVRMSLVAIAILVVAGGIGSRYPGLGAGLLGAKAALCAAIWLCAYAAISGDDRLLVR
ncbi:MAG TPA: hypothetical protein VGT98_02905, partial [Candidatus Elarobacter sp.]|nr:hypothetical protein [Candidatus Elarobacter sp.]